MEKEWNIDLGEFTVPTKWDDITLLMYEDMERYYADKDEPVRLLDVLHILTNKTEDEINDLPVEALDLITEKLSFIKDEPKVESTNKITIDGEEYIINTMEKLKLGEYVALDAAKKNDPYDFASMLAILCRKNGEKYDSTFEAELFQKRKEMFEKIPITKVFGLINFFFLYAGTLGILSQLYIQAEEDLNYIQQTIKNSTKIGAFKKWRMNSQVKKLQKSLKSIKSI